MKVGDLVKFRTPPSSEYQNLFPSFEGKMAIVASILKDADSEAELLITVMMAGKLEDWYQRYFEVISS